MLKVTDTCLYKTLLPYQDSVELFVKKYNQLNLNQQKEVRMWLKDSKKFLTQEIGKKNVHISSLFHRTTPRQSSRVKNNEQNQISLETRQLNQIFGLEVGIYWGCFNSQTFYSAHTLISEHDEWYTKWVARSFDGTPYRITDYYIFRKGLSKTGSNIINDSRERHVHFYIDASAPHAHCWHYKDQGRICQLPDGLSWVFKYGNKLGLPVKRPK